ncbi:MAG TPA: amino acid adenylation domain-containing protein [Candidatus Angelobacter sp.]|nr:amino acid adenylation domain-containing protein [Candidatus Angelobacter sp.]
MEAALQAIAEVGQVAVIAREDGPGGKQLVAYLTPENGVRPDPSTVRQKLKDSLPEHMVPAAFVVLDELPLTPAGKLDIQALPAPNRQTKIHRPPLTDTQTGIAKLFSEVLSIGQAGLDDNFFHLGGDSILTMQLVSRARAMGLLLTPRDVFQQPTVEALAAVAKVVETVEGPSMVNEAADGVGVVVPTPIMHSLFESYGPIDRFTQSVLLHVPVKAQKADLVAALQAVLDTHDVLRLKLDRDERGYRLQVRERGAVSAESCFLKVDSPGADAKTSLETLHRIQRAAEGRLDPQRGVMMQMVWLPGEARLLWVIHHLAVDGVSWRILIPDLASAWQAIQRGARPALEPVQTSFRAWASYLSANAATAAIEAEESVWAAMLASRGSLLPGIVLDSQKDTVSTTGQLKVALPPSTTQALLTSVPSAFHANINDVLLTALALSVARWHNKRNAGTASLSVDLEGHGRESLNGTNSSFDLSRTVGWFTSLFPVSLSLGSVDIEDAFAGGPSLGRALKQVKEQLRAVPGKGLGYGLLRYLHREVGPRLAALPTPQVGFNYLGRFAATRERTDWSIVGDGEGLGGSADGQMPIAHLLEINALTLDGSSGFNGSSGLNGSNGPHRPNGSVEADESHGPSLHASWDWAKRHLTEADAQALADGWCATLEALARYCAQPGVGGNTPSDFPLVALTIEQVEDLERACPDLEDVLPLSSLQEGMLFHGLYERDASHAYTVQLSMEFVGEMDAARMRSAAEVLLHRHPNLRVSLLHQGLKDPVQVVPREANLPWSRVDLTGLDSETQRLRCQELLASDREQRFEFSSGPLLRFTWIALGPHRSRLVFTNHHLLMDGWSMPVLLAELLTLYRDGQDAAQLPRVRPYSDYLKWLSFQDRKEALGIWKEYLTGVEDATRLVAVDAHLQVPSEHSKPKHSKKDVRHDVPEDLTERLQILAREQGVTLNTVLQGLWAVLTARLTGKADVVFGATVAGRPADLPGVERMVGLFINTLPLRVRLRPEEPLRDMLARLQQSQARLLNIQYVGLAEIQAEIQKETGTVELFDTLVVFENYPLDRDALSGLLPGVHINNVETQETAHYPVVLTVAPGRCLHLQLDYDERRLAPESAASLMARLMRLLEAASDPAIPVSKLRILLEDEAQSLNELLHPIESHPSKEPLPQNSSSLVELFEAQVAQAPEATAIIFGEDERKISYAELDVAATRAAHQLCSLGVCRGDLVALRLERGPEFIVAVLAILKAGAAYMPLDIAYPVERVDFMLSDSGAQLLIIKEHASFKEDDSSDPTTFPRYSGRILSMDELLPETVAACSDPVPARHPSDLAYVIYTSGSTGQPKGIAIPQSAVVRLVRNTNYIELGPGDRITHASNTSFDAATFEIWGALLNGGALVILSRETMLSSSRFSTALREFRVDSLFLTTALFQQIVSENPDAFAGVRDLLFGGETIDPSFVRCVLAARRPLRLLHVYGPTENTTFSSWQAVNNVEIGATTVPIGNSISNSRCYVLDQWLDLAPPGVTGELFVSGAGLALGYWNRRARTAESFVADPYGSPGTRMYRTGDLARWNNVGVVEFVGRADQQVKIRGFRIELGEIEAVLREQPGIAQAAVVAQRDDSGTQLVAYLVPADTAALDIEVLRRSLREKLPDYMLPAAFVLLDVLPLTPNGKLDRRSLPAPEWEGDAYVAPETEEEKAICSIFSELLSLERVGVEDDFFVLGGHSLTAMRVVGRVRALLGVDISVRDVFSARTARALSNSILASQLVSNLKNGHSATESHDNLEFEEEEI